MYDNNGYLFFNKTDKEYGCKYKEGDIITILYDPSEGYLKFLINEKDHDICI